MKCHLGAKNAQWSCAWNASMSIILLKNIKFRNLTCFISFFFLYFYNENIIFIVFELIKYKLKNYPLKNEFSCLVCNFFPAI